MNRDHKLAILHMLVFSAILGVYLRSTKDIKWVETGLHDIEMSERDITTKLIVETPQQAFFIILIAFPFITAMFHFFRATGKMDGRTWRFVEYSITSTLMLYLLGQSCNVLCFDTMLMILSVNFTLMLLGIIIQRLLSKGDVENAKLLTGIGWLLFVIAWVPLYRSFYNAVSKLPDIPGIPSKRTFNILFYSLITMYASFGFVQLLEVFQVMSRETAGVSYDLLSLTTKSTLVGIVAGGFFNRR